MGMRARKPPLLLHWLLDSRQARRCSAAAPMHLSLTHSLHSGPRSLVGGGRKRVFEL